MKKHERARLLMEVMSPYFYSINSPPKPFNDLFLKWINTYDVPEKTEIFSAIDKVTNDKLEGK